MADLMRFSRTNSPTVPLHPQACPDRPDELRWVIGPGALPITGQVKLVPEALAGLLDNGTLTELRVEADAVVTRLGSGRSWAVEGPGVRTALHAALAQPDRWRSAEHDPDVSDALLRKAVQELIDGSAGAFARSHGGTIELLDVRDGIVQVHLGGACDGCPAARVTLRTRLERQLAEQVPGLREVRAGDRPRRHSQLGAGQVIRALRRSSTRERT